AGSHRRPGFEDVTAGIRNGQEMIDEVNGVVAQVVADVRRLGDARPAVVGLAQERPETDARRRHASTILQANRAAKVPTEIREARTLRRSLRARESLAAPGPCS